MIRIEIVGGGLTGVLAALEAHRLGHRDITLHEATDQLGGAARPRVVHGHELRDTLITFGGPEDPVRRRLEDAGVAFDDVEMGCGSVSPTPNGGVTAIEDFSGPALACRSLGLAEPAGDTIADRIRAYPTDMQAKLSRYAQWRLGGWIDETHVGAAASMGLDRVYPLGADISTLDEVRRADSLYDALYGAPRTLGGRGGPLKAALPRDGFAAMFELLRRRLVDMDVTIRQPSLVAPQRALKACADGAAVVWAADPAALYKPLDVTPAPSAGQKHVAYVFRTRGARPAPFVLRNFTADGVVARLHLYASRGETLLCAECIAETTNDALRREILRLLAAFGGEEVVLGDQLSVSVAADTTCPSVGEVAARSALASALRRRAGEAFMLAACEPWRMTEGLADLGRALQAAAQGEPPRLALAG